ncbi:MAG: hypothetical protein IJR34_06250 [Bacteroidales bacterium]|nr:hypothetical protein [Bacteroidales bacterium]
MKTIKTFAWMLFSALFLTVACAKESAPAEAPLSNDRASGAEAGSVSGDKILIQAGIADELAKVSLTQDPENVEGGVKLAWENGDAIRVIDAEDDTNNEVFDLVSFSGKTGTFSGSPVTANSYNILYPGTYETIDDAMDANVFSQTQNGNGSTAHLQYIAVLRGVDSYENIAFTPEWAAAHGGKLKQSSVLRMRIQLPASVSKIASAKLWIPDEAQGIELSFNSAADVSSDHILVAYATLPAGSLDLPANTDLEVTMVTDDDDVYHRTLTLDNATTFVQGKVNSFKLNCNTVGTNVELDDFAGGDGSQANPYLIANARQMCQVAAAYAASTREVTYFSLKNDIDMDAVTDWKSIGNGLAGYGYDNVIYFDGAGKTISNFHNTATGNYMGSFFGILHGTLKNITFNDIAINNTNNCVGGLACWVGANNDSTWGTMENVTVNGGTVSQSALQQVGGLAGKSRNATFTNCSVSNVTVSTASTQAEGASDQGYAGISGWAYNSSFAGCSFDGTVSGARLNGGIVGYAASNVTFTNCTSSGSIVARTLNGRNGECSGGIVGWLNGSVESCSSSASVNSLNNICGGIVGQVGYSGTQVSKSSFTGTLSGKASVGGIVGYCEQAATVEQCWSAIASGNMTATQNAGGIVGTTNTAKATVIRNCYSTGYIYCNGQCCGGIVGEMGTTASVQNCYSTAQIDGQRVLGGIVGRAANMKWDVTVASGNTIDKCIAWNPSIICTDLRDATKAGGSGTIVGLTSVKNILSGGYRKADIDFQPSDSDYAGHGVDQPDCDGTNWTKGTTPGTGKTYQCPYHGTAAASTATVSSLAQTLGWDTIVWNLNGSRPTLISNPE